MEDMKLKPSEIKVGERFRKDTGDVSDLARTIDKIGLLQPIGVNSNNELVFGESVIILSNHGQAIADERVRNLREEET